MIAVIFEVMPRASAEGRYFDIAAGLRESLDQIDGFISVERFESLASRGKFLSLSFWRDEDAVQAWRTHALHRDAQSAGRSHVFADYRLRVAHVVRHYGLNNRTQVPKDLSGRANTV